MGALDTLSPGGSTAGHRVGAVAWVPGLGGASGYQISTAPGKTRGFEPMQPKPSIGRRLPGSMRSAKDHGRVGVAGGGLGLVVPRILVTIGKLSPFMTASEANECRDP